MYPLFQIYKMKIGIITILCILFLSSYSQDKEYVDSLIQRLGQTSTDTARINLLNKIAADLLYVDSEKINEFATQALDLSENINYKYGIANAYNNLGIYYRTKGIYDLAIDYFFNSLYIMEELNDINGIGRSYNLIGILYYYLENYNLSLEYYNKALEINIQQQDQKWIAGNSNNIGMIYEILGDYSKALEYYFKALETNIELNNKAWLANNYGNIGSLYMKTGNPKSLDYFFMRLKIKQEQNDIDGLARSNYLIGNYYNSQKLYYKALPYLLASYNQGNSINSLYHSRNAAQSLSITYEGIQQYRDALNYNEIFKSLNDSLNFEANSAKITRLEMLYNFRKSQRIQVLDDQSTELFHVFLFILVIFMILVAILLFGRQRALVNKQNLLQANLLLENNLLKEELKNKNVSLEENVKYLVHKNELITNISEKLVQIKPTFTSEYQNIINEAIVELQSSLDSDIWDEFEVRFNQIHFDFYNRLAQAHPELTSSDKKLCAFLQLGMTTREIATLTHQTVNSLETARSRLRKKMNISNMEISLPEYLSQF
ncbi:MAG: hypothetical protein DRI95_09650 [Bacteroidetes bacterium]|nr:MAG: hypothetical protein DRI95_09650 [Bacteroidota bacterium]